MKKNIVIDIEDLLLFYHSGLRYFPNDEKLVRYVRDVVMEHPYYKLKLGKVFRNVYRRGRSFDDEYFLTTFYEGYQLLIGKEYTDKELRKFVHSQLFDHHNFGVYDDVEPFLSELKKRDCTISAVSIGDNNFDFILNEKGLSKYLNQIVLGSKIGEFNSFSEILKTVISNIDDEASSYIYIGTDTQRLYIAESLGIKVILLDRDKNWVESGFTHCKSLTHVEKFIGNWDSK